MIEIVKQMLLRPHIENLGDGWVDAVSRIVSPASREMLLDLITGSDAVSLAERIGSQRSCRIRAFQAVSYRGCGARELLPWTNLSCLLVAAIYWFACC